MNKKILLLCLFLLMIAESIFAQTTHDVTGKITASSGEELAGVNVVIEGTTSGTVTNLDGDYSIKCPDDGVLIFTAIGFATIKEKVNGRTKIDIIMDEAETRLEGVVVTALGIRREEASLGYNVDQLNNEEISQGGTANVLKNLEGKVTGVNITNLSNSPTSSVFVNIRGATSIAGIKNNSSSNSGQPLYVIDGIPVGNGSIKKTGDIDVGNIMSELNPNDIENITILKGASAAALYGSEAGNGVILITTKSGKGIKKGIGVNIRSSIVFDNVFNTIPVQTQYLQGDRGVNYAMETDKGWGPAIGSDYANQNHQQWDVVEQRIKYEPLRFITSEDRVKEFMQTGHTSTNDVSISNNYDNGNYRFSYTNLNHSGVIPNTKMTRNTVSFSTTYNIIDKVSIESSASYTRTFVPNQARSSSGNGIMSELYGMSANHQKMEDWKNSSIWVDNYEGIKQNSPWLRPKGADPDDRQEMEVRKNNPYWIAEEQIRIYARDRMFGKVQLDYQILNPLKLTVRQGLNKTTFQFEKRIPWDDRSKKFGEFYQESTESTLLNTDAFVTFSKKFSKIETSVIAGYNFRYSENMSRSHGGNDLARPWDYSVNAINSAALNSSYSWSPGKYSSIYGTATIGYDGIIYVDITGRNDWAGIIEQNKNSYFYPSVSLSWLASNTFKLPKYISLMKFRGGVAQVGYGIGIYPNVDTYGTANEWAGATVGTVGGELVDPDIKPETNTTYEFGADIGLVHNRIAIEFTRFIKEHSNQIDNIPVVGSTGFTSMKTNVGTVRSDGYEMALTLVPIKNKNWEWSFTTNFTKMKAEITYMAEGFEETWVNYGSNTRIRLTEGELVGNMYTNHALLRVQDGKYAGQVILDNTKGYPYESGDADRRELLGNYNPDFLLGFNSTIRYKSFSLNIVASYRHGGVFISETQKRLRDNGRVEYTLTGDGEWWEGGREGAGGHPWPDYNEIKIQEVKDVLDLYITPDFDDACYIIGVFVDPRSGEEMTNANLGNGTYEDPNTGDVRPYYIENGADPNATFWVPPAYAVGNQWQFASTRTLDATNFKIKEVTLTYSLPTSFTNKFKCQGGSFAFNVRNLAFWNKADTKEDPETAFDGDASNQGVARFTLPAIRSWGFTLNLTF